MCNINTKKNIKKWQIKELKPNCNPYQNENPISDVITQIFIQQPLISKEFNNLIYLSPLKR